MLQVHLLKRVKFYTNRTIETYKLNVDKRDLKQVDSSLLNSCLEY